MQDEVNQKTVALSIRATKLTGRVLASALRKILEEGKKPPEGADPAGPSKREKADEPLWSQKLHAPCGSAPAV